MWDDSDKEKKSTVMVVDKPFNEKVAAGNKAG